jgi:methionyl aminopeptidase
MIKLKSPDEIERMRAASAVVAEVLAALRERVRPGVSTAELDAMAEELTRRRGALPAFKGYEVGGRVFPSVHLDQRRGGAGIPSGRGVSDGTSGPGLRVSLEGYYGDAATVPWAGRRPPSGSCHHRAATAPASRRSGQPRG